MLRSVALGVAVAAAVSICSLRAEAAPGTWNGYYFGADLGYSGTSWPVDLTRSSGVQYNDPFVPPYGTLQGGNGWFGGFHAGANSQNGASVFGLVGDVFFGGIAGTGRFTTPANNYTTWDINSRLVAFGTARGKLGVTNGPMLFYGTAGLAWGVTDTTQATNWFAPAPPDVGGRTSGQTTHVGYAVGAGAEWQVNPAWSVNLEYLFVDLGKHNYDLNGTTKPGGNIPWTETFAESISLQTVRFGISYHFGG